MSSLHGTNRRAARVLRLGVALLLGSATAAGAAPSGRIKVLPQATVAGTTVRLADLATLDGAAVDLGETEIGPAPEPGATRRLSGQSVLARLREAGLDEQTVYTIPATVSVTRAHQVLDEAALRPQVEAQLAERLPEGDRVDVVEVQRAARIPLGSYEIEVGEPAAQATGGGFRRTDVRIVQEGQAVATVAARVKIASFGPVVVARQPIARGALLRDEDLRVEERRLDELPTTVVTDVDQAIGREARVALAAGKPLTSQGLATAALVKRGDVVRIAIERGGMRLSVAGEALETAGAGERVRVLNDSSKRELVGRVVDHGTVLVVY
jgi:flagellar basal body P-ring formation protein FlgA